MGKGAAESPAEGVAEGAGLGGCLGNGPRAESTSSERVSPLHRSAPQRAPRPARRLPLWARPLVHDLRLQLALAASRAPLRGRPLLLAQAHRPRHRHRAARQR
eukprot:2468353-Prymnesium_polylepis.1